MLPAALQKGLRLKPAPVYAAVEGRNHVPLVEDAITDVSKKSALKRDYVHPNAAGYARIAEAVCRELRA